MKTVIEMAREAGAYEDFARQGEYFDMSVASLERFSELVRAEEREACAKVCDELDAMNWSESGEYSSGYGDEIRKRGKQ